MQNTFINNNQHFVEQNKKEDYNSSMEEKDKLEITELTALRGHYYSTILLISGGLAGLFFANTEMWKIVILACVGIYFNIVYILKFTNVDNRIKTIIKRR